MTQLENLLREISENKRCNDLEKAFEEVAIELMHNSVLVAGEFLYRIVEFEFYFNSKNHPDPSVHGIRYPKDKRQLEFGEWYFHHFNPNIGYSINYRHKGVDVTFGNKEKCIFGGILIRGIINAKTNSIPKNGPSNTVNEIINSIGMPGIVNLATSLNKSVFDHNTSLLCIEENHTSFPNSERPLSISRWGLSENSKDFKNKKYRFFDESYSKYIKGNKESIFNELVNDKRISLEQARNILIPILGENYKDWNPNAPR